MTETMKAALVGAYSDVNQITVQDVPRPSPGDKDVLIKVYASTVQTGDWRIQSQNVPGGMSFILKLVFGFDKPKRPIFGTEVSGEIAAVGAKVSEFKVGDAVVANTGMNLGGHAEYLVLPESGSIVTKPSNLSFPEAASMPFGFTTAWYFLTHAAKLQAGESVLVMGASGATGAAAVQVAALKGAKVTAVCSAENFPLVRKLGATTTYDYRSEDVLASDRRFDVICDSADVLTPKAKASLTGKGRLLLLSASLGDQLALPFTNMLSSAKVIAGVADDCKEVLAEVMAHVATGELVPVIDSVYPLSETAKAFSHVASRHKKGSVVIQVAHAPGSDLAASR